MLTVLAILATFLLLSVVGISLSEIPSTLRIPFVAVQYDGTRATQGPATMVWTGLLFGQMLSAGTATANRLYKIASADQAIPLFGRGSMLHRMAIQWFKRNQFTELWVMPVADNGAGVAATGTITFVGTATAAGTINMLLGGELVQAGVASGDTVTTQAAACAAAINANLDLPVTATASVGVLTILHRHKGTIGNDFDVRLNYFDSQVLPAGCAGTVAAMSTGATNPVLTTAIANMGDKWFNIIAHGWTDATSLTAIEAEGVRRWGPMTQIDALFLTSANGTQGVMSTLGDTRNSKHNLIVAQPGKLPVVPPSEFAAGNAAVVATYGNDDPARPFQTLELGFLPPAEGDLYTNAERNLLLHDGISTTKAGAGGSVQIDRLVTTYQTSPAGAPDTAYLDANTLLTLSLLRFTFVVLMKNRWGRAKLADDGTNFGAGQVVITPQIAKGEALGWFRDMEEAGMVQGFAQFKKDLVVQRSVSDPKRLEFLLPPNLMSQLVVTAASIQFRN